MYKKKDRPVWLLDSPDLKNPFHDFILSRQSMNCTLATIEFYRYTAGVFLVWCEKQGITSTTQLRNMHPRQYIAELASNGKTDNTCHDHARAIRTMMRFFLQEKYISEPIHFEMPKLTKKRLPVLSVEQLQIILKACSIRDKAIVIFLVDSGLRRREAINLNWGDVDLYSGLVRVYQGKGQKDRSAVVGATARRALVQYRRTLRDTSDKAPLFQTKDQRRFTSDGFGLVFQRLSARTGIYVSAHCLRRTFAILSLRAGMDALHLQNLGGWSSLDMVDHYAQMVDDDLLQAHRSHSPMDNIKGRA